MMTMRTALLPLVLGLGLASTAAAQTGEAGALRWNLKAGDEMTYGFTWSFRQKEDVGQGMNFRDVKIDISYTLAQKVTAVEAGVASIEATVTALKASVDPTMMGMPMGKMGFDSEAGDEGNLLKVLREAVGKSFTFKLAPNGAVSDVSGGQAIRDAVSAAAEKEAAAMEKAGGGGGGGGGMGGMGGMMGPGMVPMLAARLTVAFADETLQTTLDIVNHVLPPEGKADKGSSWTRDVVEKLPQMGSVAFKGKYTHRGASEAGTRIKFLADSKVEMAKAESGGGDSFQEAEKSALSTMKMTRTEINGKATFGAGHLVKSEVVQEIEAEGELPPMLKQQAKPDDKLNASFKLVLSYEKK